MISADLQLYQRGGMVVRPADTKVAIAHGGVTKATRLIAVRSPHIAELMTRAAEWEKFDRRAEDWVPIDCPQRVADTYLAREGRWKLPVLTGVVNCPTLRPDGSVIDGAGYDRETGLLFDSQGAEFLPLAASPDRDAALAALATLRDLIQTFPFVAPQDRAVALSAILTVLVRRSLPTAPMHAFSAPAAGTGKSLLVDIASEIADGRPAAVMSVGRTEEEAEKRLGAALIAGDAIVSLDNIDRPFGGELFCQALTQTTLKIRVLGLSKLVEVPSNAAIFATGNNLTLIGDMTRRALVCSLDAAVERPETREFNCSPVEMIRADRGRYVHAALTILRAYHEKGRPSQAAPLGSFEVWSQWVRNALLWLGESDPCATLEKARLGDPKLETLTAVMSQWDEVIGTDAVSVKTVIERAVEQEHADQNFYAPRQARPFLHPEFREALLAAAGEGGAINSRRLGRWLGGNQGKVVDGRRFIQAGTREGIMHWQLHRAPAAHNAASTTGCAPHL